MSIILHIVHPNRPPPPPPPFFFPPNIFLKLSVIDRDPAELEPIRLILASSIFQDMFAKI